MEICEMCEGSGKLVGIACGKDGCRPGTEIPCPDCKGTGEDSRPLEWRIFGMELKAARLDREVSLREEALSFEGLGGASVYSDLERGRISLQMFEGYFNTNEEG